LLLAMTASYQPVIAKACNDCGFNIRVVWL
jgi:hypothetical protein